MDHTLVLNSTFEPINIVHWQKAVQMMFQGKVEVLEESDREIRTVTRTFRLPAVMRLIRFIPLKRRRNMIRFSRANILLRDQHTCQYCGRKRPGNELTLDHVIPAARGGKRTWENIVTACLQCNQRKGGRTPHEANMKLMIMPAQPMWLPDQALIYELHSAPRQWRVYLSWQKISF